MPVGQWTKQFVGYWLDDKPREPAYALTRGLFLRLLGVVYLIAFWSLGSQILGLIGEQGIVPAALRLEAIAQQLDTQRYWQVPTLCWINCSDAMLQGLCTAGMVLACLLIVGVAPQLVAAALWIMYLSLVTVGGVFLSFQWDTLLLETGLLAILLAPMQLAPGYPRARAPSHVAIWLIRLLLLKLMFLSGVTKITSGDETWRQLTVLNFHYFTQPLPTQLAWYAHQLPLWFQKTSIIIMYFIELIVPLAMFVPRRVRHIGCALLLLLQLLIAATGNYGFFNLLTAVLCITLLDDRLLRKFIPRRFTVATLLPPESRVRRVAVMVFAAIILTFSAFMTMREIMHIRELPQLVNKIVPFRSINGYGLFRVMTTSRQEITIQGSRDGVHWKTYPFKYKPGDPHRRPGFVAPYMPRLDWQMWFAALGKYQHNPWLANLMIRLLEDQPGVIELMGSNPFEDNPPKLIRARIAVYEFAPEQVKKTDSAWWIVKPHRDYSPIIMRDGDQFRYVRIE